MKKVSGLYLWEVSLFNGNGELLILTVRQVQEDALKKARTFLRNHPSRYPAARVRDIKFHGTIDA